MMHESILTLEEALERLKKGNLAYQMDGAYSGDISCGQRKKTAAEGQYPYAVIITCSDSRVIPEAIFSAGIGDLFVIRVAGNVMDDHQLGSVIYAVEHLGAGLVVVLGHDGCGAVAAALSGHADGYIRAITDEILLAAGDTKDPDEACRRNVERSCTLIKEKLQLGEAAVMGAVYHLASGAVEWLER